MVRCSSWCPSDSRATPNGDRPWLARSAVWRIFPPLLLGVFRDTVGVLWPGFVLLSLTASCGSRQSASVPPADVSWRASLPAGGAASRGPVRAGAWAAGVTVILAAALWSALSNLAHFDAALVGYTFVDAVCDVRESPTATRCVSIGRQPPLLAAGWQAFFTRGFRWSNAAGSVSVAPWKWRPIDLSSSGRRCAAWRNWLIMWGWHSRCRDYIPAGVGWIHFETVPGDIHTYRTFLFGVAVQDFPRSRSPAFLIFTGWYGRRFSSSRRHAGVPPPYDRSRRRGDAAFAQDILPLLALFAISVPGLMLTAELTLMRGYAYDFLAVLHASP